MKKCSYTHLIKSSVPYASEKGTESHLIVKPGQIGSSSNRKCLKNILDLVFQSLSSFLGIANVG